MKARSYRVAINLSPLDFPQMNGLATQSDFTQTDPPVIAGNKVVLKITKALILIDNDTSKKHEVFNMKSVYEIPIHEIKTRGDIYHLYTDATLGLSEAYNFVQEQLQLPKLSFPNQPIERFEREIDGVFNLLSSRN